mgnify:CR=1 FL=1
MSKEYSMNPETTNAENTPKKRQDLKIIFIIAGVILAILIGVIAFLVFHNSGSQYKDSASGAVLIGVDENMTDEEINKMLAEQSSSMRVHVWQAPAINGSVLSLGFENSASNTYDQAFRIIQNDEVIYESFPVAPGESVKDVECADARVGKATVEIFNVVDGTVYGNGVRCEVNIVGLDNDGNEAGRISDNTGTLDDVTEESSEDVSE